MQSTILCIVLPVFLSAGVSAASVKTKIHPELDPKSDKQFFGPNKNGSDYPDDRRPKPHAAWKYPFPDLQHSAVYDQDFVKDENNDNGEWKAQNDYDTAKRKLYKERREADDAKKKAEDKRVEILTARQQYDGEVDDEQQVEILTKKVEDKMRNVDDCQKQLEDAKNELKNFMDARKGGAHVSKEDISKQEHEQRAALKSAEEEQQDVDNAQTVLTDAQGRLQAMRGSKPETTTDKPAPEPEPTEAPKKPSRSGADRYASSALSVLLTALALTCQ